MANLKGKAKAYGAVSALNAIPTGKGAAIGIKLETRAEVTLVENGEFEVRIKGYPCENPSLAIEAVKTVLKHFKKSFYGAKIVTESEIPIAKGLKSSSAAANSIVLATAQALEKNLQDLTAVNLAVDASLRANVSVTGALDDAAASFFGGLVLTDNFKRRIIMQRDIKDEVLAVILLPKGKMYTSSVDVNRLRKISFLSNEAYNLILKGKLNEAVALNGLAVSAAIGLNGKPIIDAIEAGAITAGLSGTGPAFFCLCHPEKAEKLKSIWEKSGSDVIVTSVNNDQKAGVI